jgi:hypothetical protein
MVDCSTFGRLVERQKRGENEVKVISECQQNATIEEVNNGKHWNDFARYDGAVEVYDWCATELTL